MGRPEASNPTNSQPHFQAVSTHQIPETIDDAPPTFEEISQDENHGNENEQQSSQSQPTQKPSRKPQSSSQANPHPHSRAAVQNQMRSPIPGGTHQATATESPPQAFPPVAQDHHHQQQPQAFPPPQDTIGGQNHQAFPPVAQDHHHQQPQAFPPPQINEGQTPQAFPPLQNMVGGQTPQAFPPPQDMNGGQNPQAFPPPQDIEGQTPQAFPPLQPTDEPQAFLPPQAFPPEQQQAFNSFPNQNMMHFTPDFSHPTSAPAIGVPQNTIPQQPIPPLIITKQDAWKTGLFECCNDPGNAVITFCFPCVTFGQIAEVVDSGQTSCGTGGLVYGAIACCLGIPCVYSCTYRAKIRARFGLIESPAPDWIIHCFCETCALCQEYRELQLRGLDPSIGWQGNSINAQNGVQMASMTPPMRQTMMG